MSLHSGQLMQINKCLLWLLSLWVFQSYHWCCNYISLTASLKFFSSKCKKIYKSEMEVENLSLLCASRNSLAFSSISLLLCLLPLLYCINILHPLPSSRLVLTVGTYRKEGRTRKVSWGFDFKLCASKISWIEWMHIS